MDTERFRIEQWSDKFYKHLEQDHSDLIDLYRGRIHWFPKDDGKIEVGLNELDERYATKEQIDRMHKVIFDFEENNPV